MRIYHERYLLARSIEEDCVLKVESIDGNYSIDGKSLKELVFPISIRLTTSNLCRYTSSTLISLLGILRVGFLQAGIVISLAILLANFKGK